MEEDEAREWIMTQLGLGTIRFRNDELRDLPKVLGKILNAVEASAR